MSFIKCLLKIISDFISALLFKKPHSAMLCDLQTVSSSACPLQQCDNTCPGFGGCTYRAGRTDFKAGGTHCARV